MNGVAIAGVLAIVSSILPAVRIQRLPVVDVLRGSQ
jgi:ABC-type lipoprotein release transport system permease subunit